MKLLLLALAMVSCAHVPAPPPPPATCATACARLRALGCPASWPTFEGTTCEQICMNIQGSGIVAFDLECRTAAASCMAADECERR